MTIEKLTSRGVALISVMIVVAIVSATAAQLLYRQSIDIERSTRIMGREQAFLYAFGLETYARELLTTDNSKIDYYFPPGRYEEGTAKQEYWSWPIPNQEMSDEMQVAFRRVDANVSAKVIDLSGLFNLNGVRQSIVLRKPKTGSADEWTPNPWEEMYEQTFKGLVNASFSGVDSVDADALWNALVDWFDKDNEAQDGGAEDDEYLDYDPPYLTGTMRMAWPEEVQLIQGFRGKVAERLLPLFSALPHESIVKLNINTAEDQLLRHIPGLDQSGVVAEIRSRIADEIYFRSTDQIKSFFGSMERTLSVEGIKPVARFFDVKSDFFLFSACVRFGRDRPIEIQSVLHRKPKPSSPNEDKVVVLQRRIGSGYYKGTECKATFKKKAEKEDISDDSEDYSP